MKLDKMQSKKNKGAVGLASVLLSIVMVGSGLSLAGCTEKEKQNQTETKTISYESTEKKTTTLCD